MPEFDATGLRELESRRVIYPSLDHDQVAEYSCLREEKSLRKMIDTTGSIASTARAVRQTGCGAMDLCFLARGSVDVVFGGERVVFSWLSYHISIVF